MWADRRLFGQIVVVSLSILAPLSAADKPPSLAVAPFDATKAKQHQEAWAKHLKVDVETTNSIGMKLRLIPPGDFAMGIPKSEKFGVAKFENEHPVRITRAFYLGNYEVTQAEFKKVMQRN